MAGEIPNHDLLLNDWYGKDTPTNDEDEDNASNNNE